MKYIKNRIIRIISKQFGINQKKISMNSYLIKDLGANSLDIIELIMLLEKKYKIEFVDEFIEKITTVKSVINFIKFNKK
ncbi:MAG: acyl carrier protein [gamma proteobacterium endosymbiont of Trioza apicalis]